MANAGYGGKSYVFIYNYKEDTFHEAGADIMNTN